MTKFLIIDGNSIGCRAAFSCPKQGDLVTKEGIPSGLFVRMLNMLNKIMLEVQPTHIVCAWDTDSNTFRKQLYPEYKANRVNKKLPDHIDMNIVHKQFQFMRFKILEVLGIKNVNMQGYEGDDICGSFAAISKADETLICSGDKDSWQLVDDKKNIKIIFPKSGFTDFDLVDESFIESKCLVKKANYIGLKMLQGDVSDNVKGWNGCGPKSAAKILNSQGSIDALQNLDTETLQKICNRKMQNSYREWADNFQLIKTLMTIKTDIDLSYTFDDCKIDYLCWEQLIQTFKELEMFNFLNRIRWGAVFGLQYPIIF